LLVILPAGREGQKTEFAGEKVGILRT